MFQRHSSHECEVLVRLEPSMKKKLLAAAQKKGLRLSPYVRQLIIEHISALEENHG